MDSPGSMSTIVNNLAISTPLHLRSYYNYVKERQQYRVQIITSYNQAVDEGRLLYATLHAWQDAIHYDALCYQLQRRRLLDLSLIHI
eukprot:1975730-Heterocapsa_arctica.AAC.1